MVVNFRVRGISRGARKLTRTLKLIKKILNLTNKDDKLHGSDWRMRRTLKLIYNEEKRKGPFLLLHHLFLGRTRRLNTIHSFSFLFFPGFVLIAQ